MKIQVGIPTYTGKLSPETFKTVKALSAYEGEVSFNVAIVPNCYSSSEGRNIGVSLTTYTKKQKLPFDYYLSMDADNACNVADVLMLLDRRLDIVSAAYPMRSARLGATIDHYVAANWRGGQVGIAGIDEYLPIAGTRGLLQVDTVGLGCCLIKASVFEAMEYPYFRNEIVMELKDGVENYHLAADDVSFCVNAARYGFKIHLDADVVVFHDPGNGAR